MILFLGDCPSHQNLGSGVGEPPTFPGSAVPVHLEGPRRVFAPGALPTQRPTTAPVSGKQSECPTLKDDTGTEPSASQIMGDLDHPMWSLLASGVVSR